MSEHSYPVVRISTVITVGTETNATYTIANYYVHYY